MNEQMTDVMHTFMKMSWAQLSVSESQKHRHAILHTHASLRL